MRWDELNPGGRFLIGVGLGLVIVGILWALGGKNFSLGKLPGDLSIERKSVSFYFPLTSSLVVSALFSLAMLLLGWLRGR